MSAVTTLSETAASAAPITLPEVLTVAELQTRVDHKYLVRSSDFAALAGKVADTHRVLTIDGLRLFRYESTYFDTPGLDCYRDHVRNRRKRYKIRTRTYLDSQECLFEVKLEGPRESTVKKRDRHACHQRHLITEQARRFLSTTLSTNDIAVPAESLRPVLTTAYRRTTFVDPRGGNRITCDVALTCSGDDSTATANPDHVLVETKSTGRASPVDQLLREHGVRPVSISKYCVGLAALNPALPSNRWHRVLKHYFGAR